MSLFSLASVITSLRTLQTGPLTVRTRTAGLLMSSTVGCKDKVPAHGVEWVANEVRYRVGADLRSAPFGVQAFPLGAVAYWPPSSTRKLTRSLTARVPSWRVPSAQA